MITKRETRNKTAEEVDEGEGGEANQYMNNTNDSERNPAAKETCPPNTRQLTTKKKEKQWKKKKNQRRMANTINGQTKAVVALFILPAAYWLHCVAWSSHFSGALAAWLAYEVKFPLAFDGCPQCAPGEGDRADSRS